ncbi:MAG: helix-hairpin-helix domain-containing protein, partial [Candidatus Nanoarchaeia archaeon]|nr:helix-hairpin-helix domain-containing protein [Candidatus Nanoarchaeia archaeon]
EDNLYSIRNMHPNAIRGMLSAIAIDFQIPIIYTRNVNDTVALIESILNRLEKGKMTISLLKKRKPLTLKERQELVIESFPGIGPTLAKSLLKEFKTIKNIINSEEKVLQKVDKLGPKKSTEIKKVIDEEYKD